MCVLQDFRMNHLPNKLWVKMFEERYVKGRLLFNVFVTGESIICKSISKAFQKLQDGLFSRSVMVTDFWYDPWGF